MKRSVKQFLVLMMTMSLLIVGFWNNPSAIQAKTQTTYKYTTKSGEVFQTTCGYADVRFNGKKLQNITASFAKNMAGGETIRINDYYRGSDIMVATPQDYYEKGDSLLKSDLENLNGGLFMISASEGPINVIGNIEDNYILSGSVTVLAYDKDDVSRFYIKAKYYGDEEKTIINEVEAYAAVAYKESNNGGGQNNSTGGTQLINPLPTINYCSMCHGSGICQACYGKRRYYVSGYGVTAGSYVDCQGCHGDGKCWVCHGTGRE